MDAAQICFLANIAKIKKTTAAGNFSLFMSNYGIFQVLKLRLILSVINAAAVKAMVPI